MNHFKQITVLSVAVAILFVLVLFLLYLNFYKTPVVSTPTEVLSPTTAPTIGSTFSWKTYTNTKYNFSLQYPNDWEINLNNNMISIGTNIYRKDVVEGGMSVIIKPTSMKLIDFLHQFDSQEFVHPTSTSPNNYTTYSHYGKHQDITFAGTPATQIVVTTEEGIDVNYVFLTHNQQNFIISFDNYDQFHHQILSTFKFTNQTASGWLTYNNSTYGFSIKYPQGWRIVENKDSIYSPIGFGPANVGEDISWVITINSHKSIDEIASEMGKQFGSNRKEYRQQIKVNGRNAVEVTVTTPTVPTWIYQQILIPVNDITFAIGSGALEDSNFTNFYESFILK